MIGVRGFIKILKDWKIYYFLSVILIWYTILVYFVGVDITKSSFLSSTYDSSQPLFVSATAFNYIAPFILFSLTTLTSMEYDQYKSVRGLYRNILSRCDRISMIISNNYYKISKNTLSDIKSILIMVFDHLMAQNNDSNMKNNISLKLSMITMDVSDQKNILEHEKNKIIDEIRNISTDVHNIERFGKSLLPQMLYSVIVMSSMFFYTMILPSLWSSYAYITGNIIYVSLVLIFVTILSATNDLYPIFSKDSESYDFLLKETHETYQRIDVLLPENVKM